MFGTITYTFTCRDESETVERTVFGEYERDLAMAELLSNGNITELLWTPNHVARPTAAEAVAAQTLPQAQEIFEAAEFGTMTLRYALAQSIRTRCGDRAVLDFQAEAESEYSVWNERAAVAGALVALGTDLFTLRYRKTLRRV